MNDPSKYIVGTSGYWFADWVGPFYPPGTAAGKMFDFYAQRFEAVEVNFTYYRMPTARTMASLDRRSPESFAFWVKANQETTHKRNREVAGEFIDNLGPLTDSGKLAGVLLQFPQSFHRTVDNRKYLAATLDDFASVARAVEFRHCSWEHPSVLAGLQSADVSLVVPDAPAIPDLYHCGPALASRIGYLRLHSRNADLWYAGAAERYDYRYSDTELADFAAQWAEVEAQADRVYAFFNNCHRGQAADNAQAFRRVVGQIT